MKDIFLICGDCQNEFIYTRGQQWLAQQAGTASADMPTLCPMCTLYAQRVHAQGKPEAVQGVVKWYDTRKGYGFLALDDGREIFLHSSGIATGKGRGIKRGKRVQALLEQTEKGLQATEVAALR
jgi:CspA family cold shock protein